jgi:hypothetical protein
MQQSRVARNLRIYVSPDRTCSRDVQHQAFRSGQGLTLLRSEGAAPYVSASQRAVPQPPCRLEDLRMPTHVTSIILMRFTSFSGVLRPDLDPFRTVILQLSDSRVPAGVSARESRWGTADYGDVDHPKCLQRETQYDSRP